MKTIYEAIMEARGYTGPLPAPLPPPVRMLNAEDTLKRLLSAILRRESTWLPDYAKVAQWLTDNKRKGLFLYGKCGTGKTLIATRVIPYIFEHGTKYPPHVEVCHAREMNDPRKLQDLLNSRVKIIDDVGAETPMNDYGIQKWAFCDVVDTAEQRGQLLIVTSNLTGQDIRRQYGERTYDRLRNICQPTHIEGQSLRGVQKIAF